MFLDMSKLEGRKAEGGTLTAYCKSISGDAQEKSFSEKISTIAHDWREGTGDYTQSKDSADGKIPENFWRGILCPGSSGLTRIVNI